MLTKFQKFWACFISRFTLSARIIRRDDLFQFAPADGGGRVGGNPPAQAFHRGGDAKGKNLAFQELGDGRHQCAGRWRRLALGLRDTHFKKADGTHAAPR